MAEPVQIDRSPLERGYETSDVRPRSAVLAAAGLSLILILVGLAMWALLTWLHGSVSARRPSLTTIERTEWTASEPQLQVNPQEEVGAHRRAAEQRLGSYGWIDRERNLAHIPIDEAMRRLVERGWPSADPRRGEPP